MRVLAVTSDKFIESILREEWKDDEFHHIHFHDLHSQDATEPSSGQSSTLLKKISEENPLDLVIVEADSHKKLANFLHSLSKLPSLPKALTLISSDEVYSPDAGDDVDETYPVHPSTEKGRKAVAMEKECNLWGEAAGIPVTILRSATPFGSDMEGWPVELFHQVLAGRYLHVRGIEGKISIVTGLDLAHATRLTQAIPGIFNIADGVGPTWLRLAEAMSANAGAQKRMITIPIKWANLIWKLCPGIPAVAASLSPQIIECRSMSRSLSPKKVMEMTGMTFFNTLQVLSRTDKNYPYKD